MPLDTRLILLLASLSAASLAQDTTAWLEKNATLVFHDAFEREKDGNLAKAIGNGWNSATADHVPRIKMADLDGGILKAASASEAAKHLAHIHQVIARHRSEGFAHRMKRWFRFLIPNAVWIGDVKIWKVR